MLAHGLLATLVASHTLNLVIDSLTGGAVAIHEQFPAGHMITLDQVLPSQKNRWLRAGARPHQGSS